MPPWVCMGARLITQDAVLEKMLYFFLLNTKIWAYYTILQGNPTPFTPSFSENQNFDNCPVKAHY